MQAGKEVSLQVPAYWLVVSRAELCFPSLSTGEVGGSGCVASLGGGFCFPGLLQPCGLSALQSNCGSFF